MAGVGVRKGNGQIYRVVRYGSCGVQKGNGHIYRVVRYVRCGGAER
jgi:hypothetical protein